MLSGTDVFVIGGGPAGLAAAIAARQRGLDVIVADGNKPPIDKACGEGLMPDSVEALRRLGVEFDHHDGVSFSGIRFVDERTTALARFSGRLGVGLRRTVLHERMLDRANACGVKFLWETPVTGLQSGGVKVAGGNGVAARWIVGADGTQSQVRRWAGLEFAGGQSGRFACRGHFAVAPWSDCVEINWAKGSQAYVTPVSDHEVCVVVVSRQENCRLPSALGEFPELARRLGNAELSGKVRGAITGTRGLRRVYRGNVALIGDASGGVDAITGEGLSLSFHQAEALAEAMAVNDLNKYQLAHRRFSRRPAFMARVLLLLDGRTHLRRRVLKVFARYPEVFERLVSIHVGETSPAHFATTGAQLGWRLLAY
jgi:2-polyprenyl-6-methoxyphenol hydroxylase-like FAD-dependent oxidoreductase